VYGCDACSYAQPSRFAASRRLGSIEQRIEVTNDAASLVVQKVSRWGKTDIAPVPNHQWTADLLLQTFDLLA
jgi:hypothetical protein